jgi:hypothetical protein
VNAVMNLRFPYHAGNVWTSRGAPISPEGHFYMKLLHIQVMFINVPALQHPVSLSYSTRVSGSHFQSSAAH